MTTGHPVVTRLGSFTLRMGDRGSAWHLPTARLRVDDHGVHLRGPFMSLGVRPEAEAWLDGAWLRVPWSGITGALQFPLGFVVDLPDQDFIRFTPLVVRGHGFDAAFGARGKTVESRFLPRWREVRMFRGEELRRSVDQARAQQEERRRRRGGQQ